MLRPALAVGVIVLTCGELISQQSTKGSCAPACTFSDVYRRGGWKIPGVTGASEKAIENNEAQLPGFPPSRQPVARGNLSTIPGVFVTQMKAGDSDLELEFPYCSISDPGRLIVGESKLITVQHLWRFDFNGKIFAYGLEYAVKTDPPTLAFGQILFHDVDGQGTFTVAKKPKPFFFRSLEVPEWAKQ